MYAAVGYTKDSQNGIKNQKISKKFYIVLFIGQYM